MSGLILASSSATRAYLLRQADIAFEAIAPNLDEEALKRDLRAQQAGAEGQVRALARAKALSLCPDRPRDFILGCDQMLVCAGQIYDKPKNRAQAHAHLLALSAKPHQLLTAAALAQNGQILWEGLTRPSLTMRALSPEFVDAYLDRVGEAALASVGGYQLEGLGVHLFEAIEGDWFSILGLPLLPLLGALRMHGLAL